MHHSSVDLAVLQLVLEASVNLEHQDMRGETAETRALRDDCVSKYMSMTMMIVIVDLVGFRFSMLCPDKFVHSLQFFFRGFLCCFCLWSSLFYFDIVLFVSSCEVYKLCVKCFGSFFGKCNVGVLRWFGMLFNDHTFCWLWSSLCGCALCA